MARDAALGMDWLHSVTNKVHRDLKSANLLVDFNNRIKIADFGFAQLKTDCALENNVPKGTLLWMAPEIMLRQPYNEKVDVYSFAIVLWEIITRKKPFPNHTEPFVFCKAVCLAQERPPIPPDIPQALQHLLTICWSPNPQDRIAFDEIVFRLSEIIVDLVVESPAASDFWKRHFLEQTMLLQEKVEWSEFRASLIKDINIDMEGDEIYPFLNCLKSLLVKKENGAEVVSMGAFDKITKSFGAFFDPLQGVQTIKELNRLMEQSWFHGDLTFLEANSRLARQSEGSFLIRLSSSDPNKTPFTLSLPGDRHFRLERVGGGAGYRVQNRVYSSLYDLVTTNSNLKRPCPKEYIAYGTVDE